MIFEPMCKVSTGTIEERLSVFDLYDWFHE